MVLYRDQYAQSPFLTDTFGYDSRAALGRIFAAARAPGLTAQQRAELNRALEAVLTQEKGRGMTQWHRSPSGESHFFIAGPYYMLFSIEEVMLLVENCLFLEGDADVCDLRWMEEDHLLLFDDYCIFRNSRQRYLCHYSHDENAFLCALRPDRE